MLRAPWCGFDLPVWIEIEFLCVAMEAPAKRPRLSREPEDITAPDDGFADDANPDVDADMADWEEYNGNEDDEDEQLPPHPLESIAEGDESYELAVEKAHADNRFFATMAHIFHKYGRDFEGIGDEIDLVTGEIVVNNGHLENMLNEVDVGDVSDDDGSVGDFLDRHSQDAHNPFLLDQGSFESHNMDNTYQVYGDMYYDEPVYEAVEGEPFAHAGIEMGANPNLESGSAATNLPGLPGHLHPGGSLPYSPDAASLREAPFDLSRCGVLPNVPEKYEFPVQEGQNSIWAPDYLFDKGAEPDDLCSARINLLVRARQRQLRTRDSLTVAPNPVAGPADEGEFASSDDSDGAKKSGEPIDPQLETCEFSEPPDVLSHGTDTDERQNIVGIQEIRSHSGANVPGQNRSTFETKQKESAIGSLDFDSACVLSDDESPLIPQNIIHRDDLDQGEYGATKVGKPRARGDSGRAHARRVQRKHLGSRSHNIVARRTDQLAHIHSEPQKPDGGKKPDAVIGVKRKPRAQRSQLDRQGNANTTPQKSGNELGERTLEPTPPSSKHRFTDPLLATLNPLMNTVSNEPATLEAISSLQDLVQSRKRALLAYNAQAKTKKKPGAPRKLFKKVQGYSKFKELFPSLVVKRSRGRPRRPERSDWLSRSLPRSMIYPDDGVQQGMTPSEASWYNIARYLAYDILSNRPIATTSSSRELKRNHENPQEPEERPSGVADSELEGDQSSLSKLVEADLHSTALEWSGQNGERDTDAEGSREEEEEEEEGDDEGSEDEVSEIGAPRSTIPDSTMEEESLYFFNVDASAEERSEGYLNDAPSQGRPGDNCSSEHEFSRELAVDEEVSRDDEHDDMTSKTKQESLGGLGEFEGRTVESVTVEAGRAISVSTESSLTSQPSSREASPTSASEPLSQLSSKAQSLCGIAPTPPSPKTALAHAAFDLKSGPNSPKKNVMSQCLTLFGRDDECLVAVSGHEQNGVAQETLKSEGEPSTQSHDTESRLLTAEERYNDITNEYLDMQQSCETASPRSESPNGPLQAIERCPEEVDHGNGTDVLTAVAYVGLGKPTTRSSNDQNRILHLTPLQPQITPQTSKSTQPEEAWTPDLGSEQRTEPERRRATLPASYTIIAAEDEDQDTDELGTGHFAPSSLGAPPVTSKPSVFPTSTTPVIRPTLALKATAAPPTSLGGEYEIPKSEPIAAAPTQIQTGTSELPTKFVAKSARSFVSSQHKRDHSYKAAASGSGRLKSRRREKRHRSGTPRRRHTSIGIPQRDARDDGRICGTDGYRCDRDFCFKCLT